MQPIKIYLDQKDYSRIGRGISGDSRYQEDFEIYKLLLCLVNSGKVRIYFSNLHAIEALRYQREKIELLKPYCMVIDTLTQGHCIKHLKKS